MRSTVLLRYRTSPISIFLGIALLYFTERSLTAVDVNSFQSREYGYSLKYPADWSLQSRAGVYSIENFAPTKTVRGVRLPPGGAGITIRVWSPDRNGGELPKNLDDWASRNTIRQHVLSRKTFEPQDLLTTKSVIEVRADCCGVPPLLQYTEWFFEVDGHFFQTSVVYWQGDPAYPKLEDTLKGIIRSLEITH